jgi:hypothetical protein
MSVYGHCNGVQPKINPIERGAYKKLNGLSKSLFGEPAELSLTEEHEICHQIRLRSLNIDIGLWDFLFLLAFI